MRVVLRGLRGSLEGRTLTLDQATITFGRDPACAVALDATKDPRASSRHCELVEQGGAALLRDLASLNGTTLDGQPVGPAGSAIRAGSVIALGGEKGPAFAVESVTCAAVKAGIGVATLEREVARVTERHEARTRRVLVAASAVALLAAETVAVVTRGAIEEKSAAHEKRLDKLADDFDKAKARLGLLELDVAKSDDERRRNVAGLAKKLREREVELDGLALRLEAVAANDEVERAKIAAEAQAARRDVALLNTNLEEYEAKNAELLERALTPWKDVVKKAERAVYSVLIGEGERLSFTGSSFAINAELGLLGTNAHVAAPVDRALRSGKTAIVRLNGDPSVSFKITRAVCHPGWVAAEKARAGSGTRSPDVGVLLVQRELEAALPPPGEADHQALAAAEPVAALGFPGVYRESYEGRGPNVAKLVPGVVSALTDWGGGLASGRDWDMIEHTCAIEPGSSGSPLLSVRGTVVGVVNAAVARRFLADDGKGGVKVETLHVGAITFAVNARDLLALTREHWGDEGWRRR